MSVDILNNYSMNVITSAHLHFLNAHFSAISIFSFIIIFLLVCTCLSKATYLKFLGMFVLTYLSFITIFYLTFVRYFYFIELPVPFSNGGRRAVAGV